MKPFQLQSSCLSRRQRGVTLIEALVALVVMSFGMVALVGLLSNLRYSGDIAKQRSEAMRLAQEELETLRSFSVLDNSVAKKAGVKDYDNDIVTPPHAKSFNLTNGNTTFVLTREVAPLVKDAAEPQARSVRVTVAWKDRGNVEQKLFLDTIISRSDPVFSLALGVTPPSNGIRQPDNRNPVIPPTAKDLGNGSSAFRPGGGAAPVWVLNNVTGVISGKCEGLGETPVSELEASSVESCKNNTVGYLVSGVIRFSKLDSPDPSAPEGDALPQPLSASLSLTPSQFQVRDASGALVLAPGRDYPTPNHECFSDAPVSSTPLQKLVNYNCIVYPNTQSPRNWWGQVQLTGLDIGTGATQYKVCRYSGDYNGNTKIDNEEHPESYSAVSYSLARQNFLVMPGKTAALCPTLPADISASRFIDYSTYQIQP
ncbi:type IV pilus modification PilV family protein [Roseateles sp. P5_E7]